MAPLASDPIAWPLPARPSPLWLLGRRLVLFSFAQVGHLLLRTGNDMLVVNGEHFHRHHLARKRPSSRSIITVANHRSYFDDPFLMGALVGSPQLSVRESTRHRWSLGAEEIVYRNWLFTKIVSLGQTVPVRRGDGVYQRGVDYMLQQLDDATRHDGGLWLNIFAQGRINVDDDHRWIRFK